jgi:hypothetical protein
MCGFQNFTVSREREENQVGGRVGGTIKRSFVLLRLAESRSGTGFCELQLTGAFNRTDMTENRAGLVRSTVFD